MGALIKGGYYVKARAIIESEVSRTPPCVRETWDYLLREANWKDGKSRGKFIKRGQLIRTYQDIITALSWRIGYQNKSYTKTQMKTAMNWLRKTSMIATAKTPVGLVITVVNYDTYQDIKNYVDHSVGPNVDHSVDHSVDHNDLPTYLPTKNRTQEPMKNKKKKRKINKESKPGDAPCSSPFKITKNVNLDSALEITNTFISQVGVRAPSTVLVFSDQLNLCLRIISERLRARSYTVEDRSNVLITSFGSDKTKHQTGKSHLGVGILLAVLNRYYLEDTGKPIVEYYRFLHAASYIRRIAVAGYGKKEIIENYICAFNEGSGIVKSIVIDGLGGEGDNGIQLMRELVWTAHDNETQMIVTSRLNSSDLVKRYGSSVMDRVLDTKNVIKLVVS